MQHARKYFQDSIDTGTFTLSRKTDTYIKVGLLNEYEGKYDLALAEYEHAFIEDKRNYKLMQHLAWAAYKLGNHK